MKRIFYILFILLLVGVSCKKQELLRKSDNTELMKKGVGETEDEDDGTKDPGIVETEDEDDGKGKKGPKGTSSK